MPRSIFGVSKLCCCFLGDLTSLSEISNTPLGPPEIILGYVYTAFHFCFQDLGHVYWFMTCFTALHFCWRWPHVSPDWSVTLSRSCSNACLAPVKHHSLNCSLWMFWPRVLLITRQTWFGNEHKLTALIRGSWDYVKVLCVLKVNISASPTGFLMAVIANFLLNVIKQTCLEKPWVHGKSSHTELALGKWNFAFRSQEETSFCL